MSHICLILGCVFGLVLVGLCCYLLFRTATTVVIVVHPWDLGTTLAEAERSLAQFPFIISRERKDRLIAAHEYYYVRLRDGLSRLLCGTVILIETPERSARSYERLLGICPRWCRILAVDSKPGRATPCSNTWADVIAFLQAARIRRVYFAGSYLGLRNGVLIKPSEMYFCINDAILEMRACGLFKVCEPLPGCCYVFHDEDPPSGGMHSTGPILRSLV